ncbi:MAG: phosphatidate cytidylyltransferase, partial [Deltaproteobacteria bacterium]|nr:phosphatidate cytidylyltransferase [Deltaproteobacteria bacterium]
MEANLKRRFFTALVIIPLLVLIIGWGRPWLFTTLILVVTAVALYEFFNMALPGHRAGQLLGILFGVTVSLLLVIPEIAHREAWLSTLLVLSFSSYLMASGKLYDNLIRLSWALIGGSYLGLLMPSWVFLFRLPNGRNWVLFVLAVIVAGDAAAYFVGRRFGGRKLAPEISPAKTVAGAWGYTIGSVIVGTLAAPWFTVEYPRLEVIALTLILA